MEFVINTKSIFQVIDFFIAFIDSKFSAKYIPVANTVWTISYMAGDASASNNAEFKNVFRKRIV